MDALAKLPTGRGRDATLPSKPGSSVHPGQTSAEGAPIEASALATDDIGYYIAENPVTVRDLQATILYQIGIDPHKFSFAWQGLNQRLIGPTEEPKVVEGLIS